MAHLLHEFFSRWLFSMDVVFNPAQLSSHEMQKYDLSGHLFIFFHQASLLTTKAKSEEPLTRLLFFLLLFRLSHIPEHVRVYAQALSLEGTGKVKFFLKAALEGALGPFLLGMALFFRVWKAPFGITSVLAGVWDRTLAMPLPPEFEVWLHSESLLAVGDLCVALTVAVFCTGAYPQVCLHTDVLCTALLLSFLLRYSGLG